MLFNSYIFIFLFLPITLLGFYILEKKQATLAKVWLTCFSLWFYGYFNLHYLLIMLISIGGNYLLHLWLIKKRKKSILVLGTAINLSLLFYFKYFNFFLSNINGILGSQLPLKEILLPLGISFFTFQQISLLADTYRGELDECGFVDYCLFVSFFPQLIAGPIVIHEEMLPQFDRIGHDKRGKEEKLKLFTVGVYVFVLGLAKKVILADTFGVAVDLAYSDVEAINGLESFLVVLFYSLQLYFDFSGYCDMAKGIAGMFGMSIANNFDSPYKAVNIIDFWKRWHITLSRFFTKNLYIPLGGSRKGRGRTCLNILTVFFLSGLWHGAGWNFILWGMMHGLLYLATAVIRDIIRPEPGQEEEEGEKGVKKPLITVKNVICRIATFSYVSVAWVYFRAGSIQQANTLLCNIFRKQWTWPAAGFQEAFNLGEFWYPMKILRITGLPHSQYYAMAGFLAVALGIAFFGKNIGQLAARFRPGVLHACLTAMLFIWCVVSLSGVSTFLYFNF